MAAYQSRFRRFFTDTSGVVAVIFALSLPMLVAAAGVGVDLAQAYNVKSRLADALDKASLAGGSTPGSVAKVEQRVADFFAANYAQGDLGRTYDLSVEVQDGSIVTVRAKADVKATFMAIFGQDTITVESLSRVKRELAGVEVVLVLDVTGSMKGSNIAALKKASTKFLDIMFSRIEREEFLKIGIVPYSGSVNVGPYGLGRDHMGAYYGPAFVERPATDHYVSPASNIKYGSGTNDWRGCILERASPDDTNDLSPLDGGMWGMYRYRACGYTWVYDNRRGWQQVYECSGPPNNMCPAAEIVPLTNDQAKLQSTIDSLTADGNTYGNVGMVWGYHVITPTEPFTEGVDLDDDEWSRTIIMMTDGDNYPYDTYSAYGANPGLTAQDLNEKFEDVCENIKEDGITIYTITFQSGINKKTKDYYRECASDASKYYDAPKDDDLLRAFEEIANQLSQLHIVN